jgi:hypothetical protein
MQAYPFIWAAHRLPLAAFAAPIAELSGLPLDFADLLAKLGKGNGMKSRSQYASLPLGEAGGEGLAMMRNCGK